MNPLSLFILPKQARPSCNTAAASDDATGVRLYLSMTEEGPSGDYKMTMQRDRHGRWMPTKREGTMSSSGYASGCHPGGEHDTLCCDMSYTRALI